MIQFLTKIYIVAMYCQSASYKENTNLLLLSEVILQPSKITCRTILVSGYHIFTLLIVQDQIVKKVHLILYDSFVPQSNSCTCVPQTRASTIILVSHKQASTLLVSRKQANTQYWCPTNEQLHIFSRKRRKYNTCFQKQARRIFGSCEHCRQQSQSKKLNFSCLRNLAPKRKQCNA